jgi:hypothetical protein
MWLLTASSESIRSAVSGGLLITLFTVWRHAIRYYVREPTNIHHGGHHTAIVTTLHNRVPFKTALSPNRRRWRSSESPEKPYANIA